MIRILLEVVLEPIFYIVMIWLAYKAWTVYGHDFISPE